MSLCDSCKKWEGCTLRPFHNHVDCKPEPITRADLAARDAEIAAMRPIIALARICANDGGYKMCHRTDDHHIALMEMDAKIKAIATEGAKL